MFFRLSAIFFFCPHTTHVSWMGLEPASDTHALSPSLKCHSKSLASSTTHPSYLFIFVFPSHPSNEGPIGVSSLSSHKIHFLNAAVSRKEKKKAKANGLTLGESVTHCLPLLGVPSFLFFWLWWRFAKMQLHSTPDVGVREDQTAPGDTISSNLPEGCLLGQLTTGHV